MIDALPSGCGAWHGHDTSEGPDEEQFLTPEIEGKRLTRRQLPSPVKRLLGQRELVDVDVAVAEPVGAAGEVVHVAVVDLFGLDRDRLVLVGLQRGGPSVQRPRVVRLQRLACGSA